MANTTKSTTARSAKTTLTKKPPRSTARKTSRTSTADIGPEARYRMIAEAAYLRAERRGFSGGDPLDDWLTAEREVDLLLAERAGQITQ